MPLSEFYRSITGKNESTQQKSIDVSYVPNDEFVELIWDKGQIMMQGQSSKAKKAPVLNNFQYQTPKFQEKNGLLDVAIPEIGLNQDDDMVPWLNYPLDDYCSDLLPEISGVTVHEPAMHNDVNLIEKGANKDPNSLIGLDQSNTSKGSRNSHLFSFSDPAVRSGVSDIGNGNFRSKPHNVIHKDPVGRLEKPVQNSTSTVLNFSHFSRPAAMVMAKSNAQNHNHHDVLNHGPQKEKGFVGQPSSDSVKVGSTPSACKPIDKPHCVEKSSSDANGGNTVLETVKSNEPAGASSSACSGNSAERASNDFPKNSKRKSHDMEDFECQSQDVEEELLGTKKPGASRSGTGSKRSRAAEVHNLSERRRRDRINEKMRALQELIPNCNKVDKASMLDEAIEYLKTLQLQVQIMSMGTGLCMPPMMFPTGMQRMHPAHFSHMGMGMGMSYEMGMGMGMNGGQRMYPFSHTTQGSKHPLPSPPIYGLPNHGMPPMILPQPPRMPVTPTNPGVRQMGPQVDVGPSSKEPMQNKNPHVITQISSQSQVANKSLNQDDKKDQVLEGGTMTA